jgi:predicted hotdog family 3-hydroxylacyl-ACP dehydratase
VRVDKAAIAALIPHTGAMCLLDAVTHWDAAGVTAVSRSHRDPRNPLRTAEGLTAFSAIEYAAQAMAVHGALAGAVSSRPRAGYLVSLRRVECSAARVDDLEGDLVIEAQQLAVDAERVMYAFAMHVGDRKVLSGTATVVLDAGAGS